MWQEPERWRDARTCASAPELHLELEALARDDDLEAGQLLAAGPLRLQADVVERVIGAVRVVVIEDEPLHLRLRGDVDRGVDRRVTPRLLEVAWQELRVVAERVGAC